MSLILSEGKKYIKKNPKKDPVTSFGFELTYYFNWIMLNKYVCDGVVIGSLAALLFFSQVSKSKHELLFSVALNGLHTSHFTT